LERPSYTLREIVARLGGEAVGEPPAPLTGVATLDSAGPADIAFLANPKYRAKLATTRAGAVIVGPGDRDHASGPRIVSENPYAYYAKTVALFHPEPAIVPGVHPTAQVHPSAQVDASAHVGAFCVMGPDARIAAGARIGEGCVIGAGVAVGERTRLHPRVTIYDGCTIGARVILHSGVVIGADGFGMARDAGRWIKIPQVGGVRIGDDVEVGANTTIDRGAGPDTVIGSGTMIDNLVQIGHNVQIGRCCVIVAQVGISGSTRLGDFVMVGGQVGMAGHLTIGDGTRIGAQAGVISDLKPGDTVLGSPAMPIKEFHYMTAYIRRLAARKKGE